MPQEIQGYDKFQLALINAGVDPRYISRRDNGKKKYQYVEGSYIMELLNQLFGYLWTWELIDEPSVHLVEGKNGVDKYGNQKAYVTVKGRLTVPMLNPNWSSGDKNKYMFIHKESYGSHMLAGSDAEVLGFSYKAAATDALKKCASMLGVAKNVYMKEEFYNYLQEMGETDEWTDQTVAMYQDQYDQMMKIAETDPELPQKIHTFCEKTGDYSQEDRITPSNVISFLEWYSYQTKPASDPIEIDTMEIELQPVSVSNKPY